MFPAATAAPFARNVVRRGILAIFSPYLSFVKLLLSFKEGEGKGLLSRKLKGALRFGPLSTTDASTFSPGPSRSDGVPHVSHVLITCFPSHYGPPPSFVTTYYVHPVLLRPTRFLIRTVTAVANFLTV